jgi:hypothetical protein
VYSYLVTSLIVGLADAPPMSAIGPRTAPIWTKGSQSDIGAHGVRVKPMTVTAWFPSRYIRSD